MVSKSVIIIMALYWLLLCTGFATCELLTSNTPCRIKHFNGICVPFKTCTFALTILSYNDVKTLRDMFCGYEGSVPLVCCPTIERQTENPTTQNQKDIYNKNEASDILPGRDVCGQITEEDKIYGGEIAEIDEFPWLARIKFKTPAGRETFACTGTLISDRYVLTAAHCIGVYKIVGVRLGEYDTETDIDCQGEYCNDLPVDVKVDAVKTYPGFDRKRPYMGDIALLRLEHPVNFTDFIQPVCLPTTDYIAKQDYIDSTYTASGWGLTEFGQESVLKRVVKLDSVSYSICKVAIKGLPDENPPKIICAGGKDDKDTCRGDSGGPLLRIVRENYKQNWYLYGITSAGSAKCGSSGVPGIYTRVSLYMDWILQTIGRMNTLS